MSHFAVMVVGDIEDNLAPFHEFESTGFDDEFVQNIDVTEQKREDYKKWCEPKSRNLIKIECVPGSSDDNEDKDSNEDVSFAYFLSEIEGFTEVPFGEKPDIIYDHKFGYFTVDAHGEVLTVVNRTNPDSKWDWYSIGGRFSDHLLSKNGQRGDSFLKSEIDVEEMRCQAGDNAAKMYDEVMKGVKPDWIPWLKARSMYPNDLERARRFYQGQPQIGQINRNTDNPFIYYDDYLMSREKYIERKRAEALCTYAYVQDCEWFAIGNMGWFGLSSDEITPDEWNDQFNKWFEALPDDALLTVVDCHI